MAKSISSKHKAVIQKKEQLDKISAQLKSEFIGIDKVIDEVIDSVSAWYIFPEIQSKPVILNLWGLTGVGKTSLIKRFVELLKYQNNFYRFDMGEVRDNNWAIRNQLEDIYSYRNSLPLIISLDEFQHARTKNEIAQETNNPATRIVWDLLDSGKFYISRYVRGIDNLNEFVKSLHLCVKAGVTVQNGIVIDNREVYAKILRLNENKTPNQINEDSDEERFQFISKDMRESIYEWVKSKFNHRSEFIDYLNTLSAKETISYLEELYEWSFAPVEVDCSKALIFVMGNLDEAYRMSNDFNPDMNADDFHEQSLKINITDIKKVLRKHFRSEQIARLGNLHIIYPAFNNESYKKIINAELNAVSESMFKNQKTRIQFDNSIHELIFREGVYPSQGTRPLFTTIHQIVKSKLSKIVYHKVLKCAKSNIVKMTYKDGELVFSYYKNQELLYCYREKPVLNLEVLRQEKKDDLQAIVAVHESGHALVQALLLRTVPHRIFSSTVDPDTEGFMYTKSNASYISKKNLIHNLARMLGGYAAEKVVFGEENITMGSESDISMATEFALRAIKNCGLGDSTVRYSQPDITSNYQICSYNNLVEDQAQNLIKLGLDAAETILKENKNLLLKLSDYLSDHRTINREDMLQMIVSYAAKTIEKSTFFLPVDEESFYRVELKKQLLNIPLAESKSSQKQRHFADFSLNADKQGR